MRRFPLALGLALVVAGCAAPRDAAASGPEARPSARALVALADSLAKAPAVGARRAVAARALGRAGLTPLADFGLGTDVGFTIRGARGELVAGFVPGRNPLRRNELVVFAADIQSAGLPAVLEIARALSERATWGPVPERTVQVVLWEPSADASVPAPYWLREAIHAIVVVGDGPSASPTVERVPDPLDQAAASALLDRLVALAREPAAPDTLATP